MTKTGPKKYRPNNEEDSPVVLLHGTSGQSEDWSQVVEQLTRQRPVIRLNRLNYAEPVTGTDSANAPAVSDFAKRVVALAGAGGSHRFDLVGFSLGAAVATWRTSLRARLPESGWRLKPARVATHFEILPPLRQGRTWHQIAE